jgi:hypothetical protein
MAITINGKTYDENKLDDKCKNAVVQVSQAQNKLKQLTSEFDNVKVLIKHHSDYLTNNLPAAALIEETSKDGEPAEKPAEEPKV